MARSNREPRRERLSLHHPRRRTLRGHGYFKRLGPGIVTGAADDDPSGIGTYSQVGAAFSFALVGSTIVVLPMAAAVQEMAARLGLVTGEHRSGGLSTALVLATIIASVALPIAYLLR